MHVTRRYLVTGRVQGVGFRYFVQMKAQEEGVRGWVRNLPGGHVEALADGDTEAMERFEQHLRQGPLISRVDRVDVHNVTDAHLEVVPAGFTIR